ncbi:hypothetical protein [Streptomyces sp. NPDC057910]|uniref:hypothetical protein n=1 Tax=Streptomyces sp. NPDC057910 TaxID=3346278 RepID=UPI001D91EB07|nr:hypothetical protein [Streptomyces sp. MAG02]
MHHTISVRSANITAAASLTAGLTIAVYGTLNDDLPRTVAGTCLLTIALLFSALLAIRRWIIDAQSERDALARAARDHNDEKLRYLAAQATIEMERQRIERDAAMERERGIVHIKAVKAAMEEQFEEQKAQLICQSLETAYDLYVRGLANDQPETAGHAKVISMVELTRQREGQPDQVRDGGARP